MNNESYFLLFANCIPVKGIVRSGICDLQRGMFEAMPNTLYDILIDCETKSIKEIYSEFSKESHEEIDKYFDWLIEKNFGIWCKDKKERDLFPKMELAFNYPHRISNIIIDLNQNSTYDIFQLFRQIVATGIPYIQLRSYSDRSTLFYTDLLELLEGSRVVGVDLIIQYFEGAEDTEFDRLCKRYLRINSLTFAGAPFNRTHQEIGGNTTVTFTTSNVLNDKCCGVISPAYFTISKELVLESLQANTCLNRKVSVDVNGDIKNCPSFPGSFGNISTVNLNEALNHPKFQDAWNIKKDAITVCKSCEFRYICTDCRAFIEDPEDLHSKPLKCGYDPFTGTWSEWSSNPLKEKAIKHYGFSNVNATV